MLPQPSHGQYSASSIREDYEKKLHGNCNIALYEGLGLELDTIHI